MKIMFVHVFISTPSKLENISGYDGIEPTTFRMLAQCSVSGKYFVLQDEVDPRTKWINAP